MRKKRLWRTKSGIVVEERGRRRHEGNERIAAYHAAHGVWWGWLRVDELTLLGEPSTIEPDTKGRRKSLAELSRDILTAERDALRQAVIDMYHLNLRLREERRRAQAIRDVANDLSAPFSMDRVEALLADQEMKRPS